MKTPGLRRVNLLICLAILPLACHPRSSSPLERLDEAASTTSAGDASPRQLALAGFHAFLVRSDFAKAQSWFDAALKKNPSEPYALFGQLLMTERLAHPERALVAALELCQRAPTHPLAASAARYIFDVAGTSTAMDDVIMSRGQQALSAGLLPGDAAHLLRAAISVIQGYRGADSEQARTLADMGTVDRFTIIGPFSAFHVLEFDQLTAPERNGSVAGPFTGPLGDTAGRIITCPDGRFNLANEGPVGDVYLLAVDLEVRDQDRYVVRAVSASTHKAYLDGTLLWSRRNFARTSSVVTARAVELVPGRHRLIVKLKKNEHPSSLAVYVGRLTGRPASVRFIAAAGPAPRWSGATPIELRSSFPDAQDFAKALEPEAGTALAEFLAIRDGIGRDRDGAKKLMAHLMNSVVGPATTSLRADLSLADRTVLAKVAHGRATRDLEATLDKDRTAVAALISRANLALDEGQITQAADLLKEARKAHHPVGYPIPLLESRLDLALGLDAKADQDALEALTLQPGLCEAQGLRYDIARRREAAAAANGSLEQLKLCPGGQQRAADHFRTRGELDRAGQLYRRLLEREPGSISSASSLVAVYVAQKRYQEAAQVLEKQLTFWPRSASVLKRLAEVYAFAGRKDDALRAQKQALQLDGGDLALRRSVERARTGKELLQDLAIDGKKAIKSYEAQHGSEDATGAYVLDAAAVRAYPDGSTVDRIHIIQKVLDQAGISELAEVSIPPGAQTLTMRTVKPDGSFLEPESIEGKDTISLPGVQVGDYVEYEYLEAHPARGPAAPGFTTASFYFQTSRLPNNWSTYKVAAPKGSGLTVDPHHMKARLPEPRGDEELFAHEERQVPPFIPEPNSPPSPTEFLPFVSVGAGSKGNDSLLSIFADSHLERGQVTYEIEEFARAAAQGKSSREAARAVHEAVMQRLPGRDTGLIQSASPSIAESRGSRLWALKASLEALGIPSRIAVVRSFAADPAPYVFPTEGLLPYVCVFAELPGGEELWLDTSVRFGPFGLLPEQAMGQREAWLMPEPGRPLTRKKTPPAQADPGKQVKLALKLTAEGDLSGSAEEVYHGFDAAQLGEALESLSPTQRNQALQTALSRNYPGAELTSFTADIRRQVGAPVAIRYTFVASRYARVEGTRKLILPSLTFPVHLGQRFVQVSSRQTPLFIDGTERQHTVAALELPTGFSLSAPLSGATSESSYGTFTRHEKQEGTRMTIDEDYLLRMARIPIDKYDGFARFAGEVDLLQARDLVLEKK